MGRRALFSKAQIEQGLRAGAGLQSAAAEWLAKQYDRPCDRHIIARALKRWPELLSIITDMDEVIGDLAEGKLFQAIKDGNMTAIIFYLKTKQKHRGYYEHREVSSAGVNGAPQGPVRSANRVDYAGLDGLSDEELARQYQETLGAS